MKVTANGKISKDKRKALKYLPVNAYIEPTTLRNFKSVATAKGIQISDALTHAITIWLAYTQIEKGS